jgi:hypothetical protein
LVIGGVAASDSSWSALGDFLFEAFDELDHSGELDFFDVVGGMALVSFCVFVGVVVSEYRFSFKRAEVERIFVSGRVRRIIRLNDRLPFNLTSSHG